MSMYSWVNVSCSTITNTYIDFRVREDAWSTILKEVGINIFIVKKIIQIGIYIENDTYIDIHYFHTEKFYKEYICTNLISFSFIIAIDFNNY